MGTSYQSYYKHPLSGDHPHACGDKGFVNKNAEINEGSSPRVWGQVKFSFYEIDSIRIIPTRVGTSVKEGKKKNAYGDHPHACGDKQIFTMRLIKFSGSSPRVWGQVLNAPENCIVLRIIPTRVGTRQAIVYLYSVFQDHPHACGDKYEN